MRLDLLIRACLRDFHWGVTRRVAPIVQLMKVAAVFNCQAFLCPEPARWIRDPPVSVAALLFAGCGVR